MFSCKNFKIKFQIEILDSKTLKMPSKILECSKKLRKLPKNVIKCKINFLILIQKHMKRICDNTSTA